ncbi:hypothetical protein VHEMI08313 [[Torrubiella] hemipterigena]|uniref:Extracellular membrane protein CFEM domain-containing protein n=1 Tax=[Torrubiella] hemipterigena TaxID=1531966 RepID=A0A0A1TD58_9HYPO|nr:hypothetical protein VHEMI08313 [[Torrubiella] hemipterigena]
MKFAIAALLFGTSAVVAEHSYYVNGHYDQEAQHRDADCEFNCFLPFFRNKCNSDNPACECTLHDMRDSYFCCVAQSCKDYVAYDLVERASRNCVAWKLPFPEFDFQAKCNIKISKETTSLPAPSKSSVAAAANSGTASAAASASATSAGGDKPASQTSAAAAAQASGSDASKTAATSGSDKPSASSSGSPAATTSAKGAGSRVGAGAGALVGLGAVVALAL